MLKLLSKDLTRRRIHERIASGLAAALRRRG